VENAGTNLIAVEARRRLASPRFLNDFLAVVRRAGLVGESKNALALLIVAVSRVLPRPLNAIVRGVSSAGKNFLVAIILMLMPADAKIELDTSSDKAWNYPQDAFRNAVVYVRERNARTGAMHPLRTLISEGKLIHRVTEQFKGRRVTKTYVAEGPVACISTTNRGLEIDDQTRHISLWADESPEQTRLIVKAYARQAEGLPEEELKIWRTIHRLIARRASQVRIIFPSWFTDELSESVFVENISARRYFPAFAEACKVICLLRSFQKTEAQTNDSKLTVSFADFAITALIFDEIFVESLRDQQGPSVEVREAVRAISEGNNGAPVQAEDLARYLSIRIPLASNKLHDAAEVGAIRRANKPERNNRKLYLPAPTPHFVPDPEELFRKLTDVEETVRFVHPSTGDPVVYTKRTKKTA
jgi:hypothetical protein